MSRYENDEEFVRKAFGRRLSVVTGTGAFCYHEIWLDRDRSKGAKCIATARGRLRYAWEKAAAYVRTQERIKLAAQDTFQYLLKLKEKPCTDCGGRFPHYVMEFDHVRGVKKFSLCLGWRKHSMADIKEELTKCELVCANCHRIRTMTRFRDKKVPARAAP